MESHKASIAIFKNIATAKFEDTCPQVPNAVFDAANRVIENKGCEFIKTKSGAYIVKYSETGPFSTQEGWLPVYVARIEQWSSGGIKEDEMVDFMLDSNR